MIAPFAERLVALSLRHPRRVVSLGLVLALVSGVYLAGHFNIRTDLDSLMSRDLSWRKAEAALEAAFANQADDLTLVVDGRTPEEADHLANLLAQKLKPQTNLFIDVERPDGGPYFEKEALLFQPLDEVKKTHDSLIQAQPILGPLAADPSLRGVMSALQASLIDADKDPDRLKTLSPLYKGLDAALARSRSDPGARFSWRAMVSGETVQPTDLRKVVTTIPRLDYSQLEPDAPARAAIAKAVAEAGLANPAPGGPQVKLTGVVAMQTDELANLGEATGPIALGSILAMLAILFWGVRSWRAIAAIAATVVVGLMATSALGLLIFQRFNLVSVAFLPLFVGLGIDFAIQFAVRYRAEAGRTDSHDAALLATGRTAGPGVALAAAATGFGFLAFWPTPYRGVSELGLIAGLGMSFGALAALSLLPSLLKIFKAGAASGEADLDRFSRLQDAAERNFRPILLGAGAAVLISVALLPLIRFDFDPISLRSRKDVSVSTFLDMARQPELSPNRLGVLAPNLGAAAQLAARLRQLPEVAEVYSAQSLIPPDQPAKLALISDASLLLDPTLNPFDVKPAPTDAERVDSLKAAAALLTSAARTHAGPDADIARRLSVRLAQLADASVAARDAAEHVLTDSLTPALDQMRATLTAEPVTLDTLPPDLRKDWIGAHGEARLDIAPRGDPADRANLERFVKAVRTVAPDVSGPPVTVMEAGGTILGAFVEAGILSTLAIQILLFAILRSWRDMALTTAPVLVSFLLTLATLAATGQPVNLENLIALPLLLGIGVSFNIYSVIAWRDRANRRTRASLSHAILFSALTTGASFTALALSAHPGTASLGRLLLIALGWTLLNALIVQPALLAAARRTPD